MEVNSRPMVSHIGAFQPCGNLISILPLRAGGEWKTLEHSTASAVSYQQSWDQVPGAFARSLVWTCSLGMLSTALPQDPSLGQAVSLQQHNRPHFPWNLWSSCLYPSLMPPPSPLPPCIAPSPHRMPRLGPRPSAPLHVLPCCPPFPLIPQLAEFISWLIFLLATPPHVPSYRAFCTP